MSLNYKVSFAQILLYCITKIADINDSKLIQYFFSFFSPASPGTQPVLFYSPVYRMTLK